jgi:hypothetical protein
MGASLARQLAVVWWLKHCLSLLGTTCSVTISKSSRKSGCDRISLQLQAISAHVNFSAPLAAMAPLAASEPRKAAPLDAENIVGKWFLRKGKGFAEILGPR